VSTGYRASKVIGANIVNDANETVARSTTSSSDATTSRPSRAVGRRLPRCRIRLVAVPYEQLKTDDKNILLPGASKDTLKALPEFKYASK